MDHLKEAKDAMEKMGWALPGGDAEKTLRAAQTHALIDIAESLRDLVGATSIFQDTVRNERIRVAIEGLVHTEGR